MIEPSCKRNLGRDINANPYTLRCVHKETQNDTEIHIFNSDYRLKIPIHNSPFEIFLFIRFDKIKLLLWQDLHLCFLASN